MFEITLANWIVITRVLLESVSEAYMLVFIAYKLVVGFAVVKMAWPEVGRSLTQPS